MQEKVVITARRKHVRIIFLEESAKRRRIHNFWDKRKKWIGTNLIHTLLISLTVSHKMMILLYLSVHKMLQDLKSKKKCINFPPRLFSFRRKMIVSQSWRRETPSHTWKPIFKVCFTIYLCMRQCAKRGNADLKWEMYITLVFILFVSNTLPSKLYFTYISLSKGVVICIFFSYFDSYNLKK